MRGKSILQESQIRGHRFGEMAQTPSSYSSTILAHWDTFLEQVGGRGEPVAIDGHGLDIASVVAISR